MTNVSAQKLYESEGWHKLGPTQTTLEWGQVLHQFVYVAPGDLPATD